MRRLLTLAVGLAVALTTAVTAQPAQARVDDPSRYGLEETYADVYVRWTLAGEVPGRPGNAHSGSFSARDQEDVDLPPRVRATVSDWQCPEGIIPPTSLPPTVQAIPSHTDCRLLAAVTISEPNGDGVHFGRYLLRNRVKLPVSLRDWLSGTSTKTSIDIKMTGLKTYAVSRGYWDYTVRGVTHRVKDVYVERPIALSGTLAGLDLADSRLQFHSRSVIGHDQQDPETSRALVTRESIYSKTLDASS